MEAHGRTTALLILVILAGFSLYTTRQENNWRITILPETGGRDERKLMQSSRGGSWQAYRQLASSTKVDAPPTATCSSSVNPSQAGHDWRQSREPRPPPLLLSPSEPPSEGGDALKQYQVTGAYCTDLGTEYSNCLFHDACVSVDDANSWSVSALPAPNWTGASIRARRAVYRDSPGLASCNMGFRPVVKARSTFSHRYVRGTHFFLCSFFPLHYGHTLMEVTIPTGLALEHLAERFPSLFPLSSGGVQLVVRNGGDGVHHVTKRYLSLLTHGTNFPEAQDIRDVMAQAKNEGKTHVCFENMAVGFRAQSSLEFAMNTMDVQPDQLQRFRHRVRNRFNSTVLPPRYSWVDEKTRGVCSCKILIEHRHERSFQDHQGLIAWLTERTKCCVRIWTMTDLGQAEQIKLVSDVDVYICPLGSGCHNFLWLKPKGVVIVVTGFVLHVPAEGRISGGGHVLNDWLCYHLRADLLCLTVASSGTPVRGKHEKTTLLAMTGSVQIDYGSFENALEWIQLHNGIGRGVWDPVRP